jgi:hypothetical protein
MKNFYNSKRKSRLGIRQQEHSIERGRHEKAGFSERVDELNNDYFELHCACKQNGE